MDETISVETHGLDAEAMAILKKRYKCPHFRILVIGKANAGKTTILEKVCCVDKGTKPIIYDKNGNKLDADIKPIEPEPKPKSKLRFGFKSFSLKKFKKLVPSPTSSPLASVTHLTPSLERGMHDIEHQITYPGSNFIFHDSRGFEVGATEEMNIVMKFIEERAAETKLKDQLHAIWYCIPASGSRPPTDEELKFFSKAIGKVPLVAIFTKFDGLVTKEYGKLDGIENDEDRWEKAEDIAKNSFQQLYDRIMNTQYPPKAHVQLRDMNQPEKNCPELTEKTANTIDDAGLYELFVSTQMNNLDLCVKSALGGINIMVGDDWTRVTLKVFMKFPHMLRAIHMNPEEEMAWDHFQQFQDQQERIDDIDYYQQFQQYQFYDRLQERQYQQQERQYQQYFEILHLRDVITSQFVSLFGGKSQFARNPVSYQILVGVIVITRKSFSISKPFKESIMDAFKEFKKSNCVQKLKNQITSESIPPASDHQDLVTFLYNHIISI